MTILFNDYPNALAPPLSTSRHGGKTRNDNTAWGRAGAAKFSPSLSNRQTPPAASVAGDYFPERIIDV